VLVETFDELLFPAGENPRRPRSWWASHDESNHGVRRLGVDAVSLQRRRIRREPVRVEVREFVEPVVSALIRHVAVESRRCTDHVREPVREACDESLVLAVVEHHRARTDEAGRVDRRWIDLTHDHVRIDSAGKSNETDLVREVLRSERAAPLPRATPPRTGRRRRRADPSSRPFSRAATVTSWPPASSASAAGRTGGPAPDASRRTGPS